MLNFIYGRACSGKTTKVINAVAENSKQGGVVLIVPEQFTFECERYVIKNKKANVDNIKVLSFTRLYSEITSIIGAGKTTPISEFENIIFINKAIRACEDNLKIFRRFAKNTEFAKEIAKTIRDFKFSGILPDDILKAGEQIGGVCGGKLFDIASIMSVYDALISDKFIDPADYLTRLGEILKTFKYFDGKKVFFDSFTGFTGQQYKIVERILEQASDVTFSFSTSDSKNTNIGLFYNINSAVNSVKSIAKRLNIVLGDEITLNEQFYSSDSLKRLETVLCDNKQKHSLESIDSAINLISCVTPRDEAVAAANIIRSRVINGGYRFKDFIVVARDASTYQKYIESQCKKNDISCFTDKSIPISTTPLYIYLKTLFDLTDSFSTENILNYIKCGFNRYADEDVSSLEEYVFIWDIKGSAWKKEWNMKLSGLDDREATEEENDALKRINSLREQVILDLMYFLKRFKGNAATRSEAIFKLLESSDCKEVLTAVCDRLEKEGDNDFASAVRQSWDSIMDILSSIVRVSDDRELTAAEYIEIFLLASDSVNICNTPQMLDEVTFGSADRIRPSKPKVAIILGCNQNVFPKNPTLGGILGQADKLKLENVGISLNDDIIKSTVEENYLVYSILCCAVDEVYILYSERDMTGTALEPSAFISKIKSNFDDLRERKFTLSADGDFYPLTKVSAFDEIGSLSNADFNAVAKSLEDDDLYASKVEYLKNPDNFDDFKISKDTAKKLFGNKLYLSASKFDTYHSCRLMYMLRYGLRTGKLQKADLNVMQRGTIAHFVFEKIVEKYGKGLGELSETQISKEVDELIKLYFDGIVGADSLFTPKFLFMLSNIARSLKAVVMHMAEEFKQSDFEPAFCELEISSTGQVPELRLTSGEGEIILSGKIDRVDTYKNAVRVVDYKTGKKSFELSDILYGLNMQMLIYLYAIIKNGGEVFPDAEAAGILYMPAKSKSDGEKLTMNGLISDDPDIYTAMEKDNNGHFIPKLKKNSTAYIDKEAFPLIFSHIENLMCKMQEGLNQGEFYPNPTDTVKKDACAYCDFKDICRKSDTEHIKPAIRTHDEIIEILKGGRPDEVSSH